MVKTTDFVIPEASASELSGIQSAFAVFLDPAVKPRDDECHELLSRHVFVKVLPCTELNDNASQRR